MKILVGSKHPAKVEAVREAFSKYFDNCEVIGLEVDSKVNAQPIGEETMQGAKNRTLHLKDINEREGLNADFFASIEGGIVQHSGHWFAFGAMCVIDKRGKVGLATSEHFQLPDRIIEKMLKRQRLGDIMDEFAGERSTSHDGGAVGYFTNGVMSRKDLYVGGVIAALIPFVNDSFR